MKIGQPKDLPIVPTTPPTPASTAATPPKAGQGAAATASQAASSAGVAVTVSTRARALEQANRGQSAAEVDTAKVDAVRSAIEQGTYVVNPEVIADKLLANAQEMLNRTHN